MDSLAALLLMFGLWGLGLFIGVGIETGLMKMGKNNG